MSDNLIEWLAEARPNLARLQAPKAEQGASPAEPLAQLGYNAVSKGRRTWNGVAILARDAEPVVTRTALPGDPADIRRYIEAAVNGVLVASPYLPKGHPRPGRKFDQKLAWFERLIARDDELRSTGARQSHASGGIPCALVAAEDALGAKGRLRWGGQRAD